MKNNKGKRSARKRSSTHNTGRSTMPSDRVVNYRGPIVPLPIRRQEQIEEVLLTYTNTVSSDGSGVLSVLVLGNPSGSSEWSLVSGLWEEYRVLKMSYNYVPSNMYFLPSAATTQAQAPLVYYSVRDSTATAPASYDAAWQIGSSRISNTSKMHLQQIAMSGFAEASFTNTRTPGTPFAIGFYASGLTLSTAYGQIFVRWLVEFRGRR